MSITPDIKKRFNFMNNILVARSRDADSSAAANADNVPADWKNAILHARIRSGIPVAHGCRHSQCGTNAQVLILLSDSTTQKKRRGSMHCFLKGGEIFMKMEETFFASRLTMLRDKFGTSWMLLHERAT
jgi:PhnB protein